MTAIRKLNGGAEYNDTNYVFPTYILSRLPGFLYDPLAARLGHLRKKRPARPSLDPQ